VDLVYDIDAVAAYLGRNLDLVHEGFDVFDAVVGGCVHLVDAV